MSEDRAEDRTAQRTEDSAIDLSIVVVSWNVATLLRRCLASCYAQSGNLALEVIVVDNASADDSVSVVRNDFPAAQLIVNPDNRGFPSGVNQGIAASRGRYVMLLNPDAELASDTAAILVNYLDSHPDVGVVGPRLAYPDGSVQSSARHFPNLPIALLESTPLQGLAARVPSLRRYYDDAPDLAPHEADWLVGACLVVRRAAIAAAGPMDGGFFMYSEELDWCQRIKQAGWRVVQLPQTTVVHHEGQSTAQASGRRAINFNVSKVRYWAKWHGKGQARLLRGWLRLLYAGQMMVEVGKWLLGHKRELRAARIIAYRQLLANGLRRYLRPAARPQLALLTAEYRPQPGGVGDYTHELAKELSAAVIVLGRSALPAPESDELAKPTQHNSETSGNNSPPPIYNLASYSWPMLRQVHHTLLRAKIDTLNIQYQTGAYRMHPAINLLPLYLKLRGNPARVIVTFHDLLLPYLFPKAGPVRKLANWLLLKFSDAAIVTNAADAVATAKWQAKISVIPIGSNIAAQPPANYQRQAWRQQQGIANDEVLLAYFGLLNQSKGLDTLLQALATLPPQYKLAIIGGSTGDSDPTNRRFAQQIDDTITRLNLQPRIIRSGQLPEHEVSAWLLGADIATMPFRDGASLRRGSLLAALAHGLPTISTNSPDTAVSTKHHDLPSTAELPTLCDGENLLLIPPDDPAALANAISTLAANPTLRQQLHRGALALTSQLGWQQIATKVFAAMKG